MIPLHTFLGLIIIVLSSCVEGSDQVDISGTSIHNDLWVDKTQLYLPVTGEWTNRVEVADLNGDDKPDLLFANGGNYSKPGPPEYSRIFLNQGSDKPFHEITEEVFHNEKFLARVIKVRDINKDNIPDIIIGTTFQTQSQLYMGLGDGAFKKITSTHLPKVLASIGDLELGDVDGDDDLDIILTDWGPGSNMNNSGGRTMLWLNQGDGSFIDVTDSLMPDILIQFSWDLEFIDYDNDFDLDIAISCKRCGTGRLYQNNGSGLFVNKPILPAYTNNYEFEVMDLNNDGFLDMVTVNDGEIVNKKQYSRREHIFMNKEGVRFIDATEEFWPVSANIGEDDNNVSFLDFDSDGDPDFILSSLTGEDRLLINCEFDHLELAQPVLSGKATPHTLSIVLSDINGDNKMDLIMGQGEGKSDIEERVFMGHNIKPDLAPPIISSHQIRHDDSSNVVIIEARIHDNKSPSMPQDWRAISFYPNDRDEPMEMVWYGEYLWRIMIPDSVLIKDPRICATDYSKNERCLDLTGE